MYVITLSSRSAHKNPIPICVNIIAMTLRTFLLHCAAKSGRALIANHKTYRTCKCFCLLFYEWSMHCGRMQHVGQKLPIQSRKKNGRFFGVTYWFCFLARQIEQDWMSVNFIDMICIWTFLKLMTILLHFRNVRMTTLNLFRQYNPNK